MLVTEGEERTQPDRRVGMRIEQRVAYHQLRTLVYPQKLFAENNAADTVRDRRARRVAEVGDILVAARLVYPLVAVQCQVERLIVLYDRFETRAVRMFCRCRLSALP
mgnify:CR=1 FL=1